MHCAFSTNPSPQGLSFLREHGFSQEYSGSNDKNSMFTKNVECVFHCVIFQKITLNFATLSRTIVVSAGKSSGNAILVEFFLVV